MIWLSAFLFCAFIATAYGVFIVFTAVHHKFMSMDISFPVRESFAPSGDDAARINEAAMVLAYDKSIEDLSMSVAAEIRAGNQMMTSWKQVVESDERLVQEIEWFVQDITGVHDFVFDDFTDTDIETIEQSYRYHVMSFLSSQGARATEG